MNAALIAQFDQEMHDVHERAKSECRYDAKLFRSMVLQLGGLGAAKKLIAAPREQSGFEKLWLLGRLDISMEARILKPKFSELFEPEEVTEARTRLLRADYDVRKCYE
ncbi:MAG: hypothetical protein ACYC96_00655 [Fimbriimonadaceae bacterium]